MADSNADMTYPVLALVPRAVGHFIGFWDALYSGYDEPFYREDIGKELTGERIAAWFKWKNDGTLSAAKARSILKYSGPAELLPADTNPATVRAFLNRDGGAIWRVFWLHLQYPEAYPIYDQHVHRAMAVMLGWQTREIPSHDPTKVEAYLDHYLPFFARFAGFDRRRTDRALWAFGKFLKTPYGARTAGSIPEAVSFPNAGPRRTPSRTSAGISRL